MLTEVDAISGESLNATAGPVGFDWSHGDDEIIDALRVKSSNSLQLTPIRECEGEHVDHFMLCMEEPEEVLRSSHSDISGFTSRDATLSGHIPSEDYFFAEKESDDCGSSMHDHRQFVLPFLLNTYPLSDDEDEEDDIENLEEGNLEMRLDEYNYKNQSTSDLFLANYSSTEEQLEAMMESLTDPVGKYMRRRKLSAREAVEIGVDRLLLKAPRKVREKYGPRRNMTQKQRDDQLKERNRCHAKATRMRRRLFRLIDARVDKFRSACKALKTLHMGKYRPVKHRQQQQQEVMEND